MESLKAHFSWTVVFMLGLLSSTGQGFLVNLTVLEAAARRGAVCLDGSPPAYHLAPGFGPGMNSWLVHIEGGGWCHNITNCFARKVGRLGSSRAMGSIVFSGILSDRRDLNPEFYNWNRVKVAYCDGSSLTGDVDRATNLHFRGARIFDAVMEDLLRQGMRYAESALLSGCSAGGLAAILHCDRFRALLAAAARVKCLSDGGFFVNVRDVTGAEYMKSYFSEIVATHGAAKSLPSSCTSKMSPGMCFFPQYVVKQIRTPLFVLNAAYDSWQIRNALLSPGSDPAGAWKECASDMSLCDTSQLEALQAFRMQFLGALRGLGASPAAGMFVNSCFAHCQTEMAEIWHFDGSPVLGNTTIAGAVAEWFYDRRPFKNVDCPYPCDSSCRNIRYVPEEFLPGENLHHKLRHLLMCSPAQSFYFSWARELTPKSR
ncbi:unnamed protein product [Spirodela intermedia]|uniref:Pectin acetylesterase n=1 Tax=Spirodela intermedia TaxID=51605 RepID=A0A7I8L9B7_SPIIN|nr:unnamed protein product [Spirodela intermedia]